MLKALVPVDGTDNALAAVRHVVKLILGREPLEVHLLHVEPSLPAHATKHVASELLDGYHHDEAEKSLAPARALLREAGIACVEHVKVGHVAHVIAELARTLGCDKVVMGTHGFGTVTQLLRGSVSHEAIHLMDPAIPVTLVKAERAAGAKRASSDDSAFHYRG